MDTRTFLGIFLWVIVGALILTHLLLKIRILRAIKANYPDVAKGWGWWRAGKMPDDDALRFQRRISQVAEFLAFGIAIAASTLVDLPFWFVL